MGAGASYVESMEREEQERCAKEREAAEARVAPKVEAILKLNKAGRELFGTLLYVREPSQFPEARDLPVQVYMNWCVIENFGPDKGRDGKPLLDSDGLQVHTSHMKLAEEMGLGPPWAGMATLAGSVKRETGELGFNSKSVGAKGKAWYEDIMKLDAALKKENGMASYEAPTHEETVKRLKDQKYNRLTLPEQEIVKRCFKSKRYCTVAEWKELYNDSALKLFEPYVAQPMTDDKVSKIMHDGAKLVK